MSDLTINALIAVFMLSRFCSLLTSISFSTQPVLVWPSRTVGRFLCSLPRPGPGLRLRRSSSHIRRQPSEPSSRRQLLSSSSSSKLIIFATSFMRKVSSSVDSTISRHGYESIDFGDFLNYT